MAGKQECNRREPDTRVDTGAQRNRPARALLAKQDQVIYQAGANVRVIHDGVHEPRYSSVPLLPVSSIRSAMPSRQVRIFSSPGY